MLLQILLSKSCSYDLLNTLLDDASVFARTNMPSSPHQLSGSGQKTESQKLSGIYIHNPISFVAPETSFPFPVLPMHGKTWQEMPLQTFSKLEAPSALPL